MANQYIGLGFVFEYLAKTWLKEKFALIESEILDKSRKIDFIVEAEGMDRKKAKIGVQLTTNPNETKLEYFFKSRYETLNNVDKAVYIQVDLTIDENEKRQESSLITFILENIAAVIRKEINGSSSIQAYKISVYDFDKIQMPAFLTETSAPNTLQSAVNTVPVANIKPATPSNSTIAKIIKKGGFGKPIIVQGEFETHVGKIYDDCIDKEEIFDFLRNAQTSIIDHYLLVTPLKVHVRMEKNQMPNKSDLANIIAIVR